MTAPSPGPAPVTPGQAAYEASCARLEVTFDGPPWEWDKLSPHVRAAWEAAAQAVIGDDLAPGERTAVRERLENLAAGMELSAAASRPSKKSEIESGCAAAVREIAKSLGSAE